MGSLLAKLRWKRTEGRSASEQPTGDGEGIRRDIPEKECEKPPPQSVSEEPQKLEKKSEKIAESPVQKVKQTENEVIKTDSVEEKHNIISETPTQKVLPTETDRAKKTLVEEQQNVSISKIENIEVAVEEEPKVEEAPSTEINTTDSAITDADDTEDNNVEGAVVKIQAGIRGYLTRKTLKEQRESQSPRKSPISEVKDDKEEKSNEISYDEINKCKEQSTEYVQKECSESAPNISIDTKEEGESEEKAAVKIQAMYRGYRTRKNLNDIGNELDEESNIVDHSSINESMNTSEDILSAEREYDAIDKITEDTQELIDIVSEENQTEAGEGEALQQAAVKIQSTFRGYKVRKQRKDGPKKEKELVTEPVVMKDENETVEPYDSQSKETTGEDKAAVKIQAMYRGYKVRKEIKLIGEDNETEDTTNDETLENVQEMNNLESISKQYSKESTDDDDEIIKSKATIVLSTSTGHRQTDDKTEDENQMSSISLDSGKEDSLHTKSLLDSSEEGQYVQKSVPESNEPKISKSISEPVVDLNSVLKSKPATSPSPSSD